MKVYCVQLDQAWEDKTANYAKAEQLLRQENPEPGSLVVLPEMFPTGYSIHIDTTTAEEPEKTEVFLAGLARKHSCWVMSGNAEKRESPKGANVSITFNPDGKKVCGFTKLHPVPVYNENKYYDRGMEIVTFPCNGFSISPFICYDLRFPEIFRIASLQGADLLVVIANWPAGRINHWLTLLQARAIENQAYVVGVNRCGKDPNLEYPGRSAIFDPQGTCLVDAGGEETIVQAELNPETVMEWRKSFPALDDARREFYNPQWLS
jgi:omega-amidase